MEKCVVVDEKDDVIGIEDREKVHSKQIWHRGVHVLLFNKEKILLQRRSNTKDTFPGCWDFSISEHVKPGESYEQAARRGLREELGINANLEEIVHLKMDYGPNDYMVTKVYKGKTETKPKLLSEEVSETKWFGIYELDKLVRERPEIFTRYFIEFYKWFRGMKSDIVVIS
ncbi:MAG: NUDIX domain-containing protein [Candidatus Diapherotrites archaeon]|nr:NUDIX domain-containing protein [Candidatus Diapherotrites archaeon]